MLLIYYILCICAEWFDVRFVNTLSFVHAHIFMAAIVLRVVYNIHNYMQSTRLLLYLQIDHLLRRYAFSSVHAHIFMAAIVLRVVYT